MTHSLIQKKKKNSIVKKIKGKTKAVVRNEKLNRACLLELQYIRERSLYALFTEAQNNILNPRLPTLLDNDDQKRKKLLLLQQKREALIKILPNAATLFQYILRIEKLVYHKFMTYSSEINSVDVIKYHRRIRELTVLIREAVQMDHLLEDDAKTLLTIVSTDYNSLKFNEAVEQLKRQRQQQEVDDSKERFLKKEKETTLAAVMADDDRDIEIRRLIRNGRSSYENMTIIGKKLLSRHNKNAGLHCSDCGQQTVENRQVQIRSSDEGASTILRCYNPQCKKYERLD